jgi:hypothetical protein
MWQDVLDCNYTGPDLQHSACTYWVMNFDQAVATIFKT